MFDAKSFIVLCVFFSVTIGGDPNSASTSETASPPKEIKGEHDWSYSLVTELDEGFVGGMRTRKMPESFGRRDMTDDEIKTFDSEFNTEDEASKSLGTRTYVYYSVSPKNVVFKLKAAKGVRLILSETPTPGENDPVYEILIGGWENQKSAIKDRKAKTGQVVNTLNILSNDEFRSFFIDFQEGLIRFFKMHKDDPYLSWDLSTRIRYLGVHVGHGVEYIIQDKRTEKVSDLVWKEDWYSAKKEITLTESVVGGYEKQKLYVCRASMFGQAYLGKLLLGEDFQGHCLFRDMFGFDGVETDYQVLTGTHFEWVPTNARKEIPENAVDGGLSEGQRLMYICRVQLGDTTYLGKVILDGPCSIEINGTEVDFDDYDILVEKFNA